jgi:hypothetical protein
MAGRRSDSGSDYRQQRALLVALSDDLALPLMQIKSALELAGKGGLDAKKNAGLLTGMALSAETGLQLIEAYRLALRVQDDASLPLEPVAVGAVLQAVAHQLSPYAKQYSTVIEVDVQRRLKPVLANSQTLAAAMQCLGASLIRAQAASSRKKSHRLMFGAHRTAENTITAGAFSNLQGVSDRALRSARSLAGRARQPINSLPAGAASGVLIADILCGAMWQPLRAAAHGGMHGLATAVPVSKQLQFV